MDIADLPITDARHELARLCRDAEAGGHPPAVAITKRGRRLLAVLPWELYETLLETVEIFGDPDEMRRLRKSVRDLAAGRTVVWDEVRGEFGA